MSRPRAAVAALLATALLLASPRRASAASVTLRGRATGGGALSGCKVCGWPRAVAPDFGVAPRLGGRLRREGPLRERMPRASRSGRRRRAARPRPPSGRAQYRASRLGDGGHARDPARPAPPTFPPPLPAAAQVTLTGPGSLAADAVTDAAGEFELKVSGAPSPAALAGGLLQLDKESESCRDAGTGAAPPVSLGALVPKYDKADTKPYAAINGVTTLGYYTKKNAAKPQVAPYLSLVGGADFDAASFYKGFGGALGIGGGDRAGLTDLLKAAADGDAEAAKGQTLSAQILNSLAVGGQGLSGLKPGVTPDQAAEAMVVATFPAAAAVVKSGAAFDLASPQSLTAVFNKALGGAPTDVVEAVADALAGANAAAGDGKGDAGVRRAAAALAFGQADLGPAAHTAAASAKDGGLDEFSAKFGSRASVQAAVDAAEAAAPKAAGGNSRRLLA